MRSSQISVVAVGRSPVPQNVSASAQTSMSFLPPVADISHFGESVSYDGINEGRVDKTIAIEDLTKHISNSHSNQLHYVN